MRRFPRPDPGHDRSRRRSWAGRHPLALALRHVPLALALTIAIAGCATRTARDGGTLGYDAVARPALLYGGHAEPVVEGESLYDFLRRTEPAALRVRDVLATGTRASPLDPPIGVYVDGHFFGGLEVLPTILATDVISMRRLHSSDVGSARQRQHIDGIIDIRLRR